MSAEEYRALNGDELSKRKALVIEALESDAAIDMEQVRSEVEIIEKEYERRNAAANLRNAKAAAVLAGQGNIIERSAGAAEEPVIEDIYDTQEYRTAFLKHVCFGDAIPAQYRADANTTTGDVPVMIPTSTMNKIIEKLETYGEIYSQVTKTNYPGGVEVPILDLNPEASWVGEEEISEYQELLAKEKVTFSYYELECRLSQSWLAQIVTYQEFERRFIPVATKAMIKKLDQGIISGTGSGQMLGITNDSRVKTSVSIAAADITDWKKWRSVIKHAIPTEYRNNGCYIMNQGTWDTYIETMADDSNAPVSITYDPITGNQIMRLMGSPVLITDQLPEFDDAANDDVFVIYGDLSNYCINSNQQMKTVKWQDPDTRKDKTLAYMVADGKVLDPYGFVLVKKGATTSNPSV